MPLLFMYTAGLVVSNTSTGGVTTTCAPMPTTLFADVVAESGPDGGLGSDNATANAKGR